MNRGFLESKLEHNVDGVQRKTEKSQGLSKSNKYVTLLDSKWSHLKQLLQNLICLKLTKIVIILKQVHVVIQFKKKKSLND